MKEYTRPRVREYGSVEEITEQNDKIGAKDDWVTDAGAPIDGSIIPD